MRTVSTVSIRYVRSPHPFDDKSPRDNQQPSAERKPRTKPALAPQPSLTLHRARTYANANAPFFQISHYARRASAHLHRSRPTRIVREPYVRSAPVRSSSSRTPHTRPTPPFLFLARSAQPSHTPHNLAHALHTQQTKQPPST
ncbi:hypothetical protein A0H81_13670 [Grifola frondosa]|uniref:Uncharacterized protein n=1 Tax=Grifola frondosa TaxID=5627 RepID=A0A1C7LQ44_GRIFR|nr:hypothetical protein A0H81_13670 [Grifola frondosa]